MGLDLLTEDQIVGFVRLQHRKDVLEGKGNYSVQHEINEFINKKSQANGAYPKEEIKAAWVEEAPHFATGYDAVPKRTYKTLKHLAPCVVARFEGKINISAYIIRRAWKYSIRPGTLEWEICTEELTFLSLQAKEGDEIAQYAIGKLKHDRQKYVDKAIARRDAALVRNAAQEAEAKKLAATQVKKES